MILLKVLGHVVAGACYLLIYRTCASPVWRPPIESGFRRRMPQLTKPGSSAILDGRAERN